MFKYPHDKFRDLNDSEFIKEKMFKNYMQPSGAHYNSNIRTLYAIVCILN